ncbi:LysR family transcriptional regulator [Variovorax paradoxus]|uniref:LysR family transcriptional regulator n=2 Tax=Variovorax paradoxus TaxID=34073 RepID=A0A6I6HQN7_VARPD|nr:LysR family transcriptional regulator [Variovorax paradoxus]
MDLLMSDVRLFVKAVEMGGLTQAADALGVPKASASRQLKRLEVLVGHALLHRGAGRFGLTGEGRIFLPTAKEVLEAVDQALAQLSDTNETLTGRLRISVPGYVGRELLCSHLAGFMAAHPQLKLTVNISADRVDLFREDADVMIRAGREGCEEFVARRIKKLGRVLCAAPSYLDRHPAINSVDDLAGHSFLTSGPERQAMEMVIPGRHQEYIVKAAGVFRANDPELLQRIASSGGGIALIPLLCAEGAIRSGALVSVLPSLELMPKELNLMYLPARRNTRKIRTFVDFIFEALERSIQAQKQEGPASEGGAEMFSGANPGKAELRMATQVPDQ